MAALRGLSYLYELIRRPGEDISALDLVARFNGHASVHQRDLRDVLDDQARDACRRRLRELDSEITEAQDWTDPGRLEQLTSERDALLSELARATGVAGIPRATGSTYERTRTAVRKAIVPALRRIEQVDIWMATHLNYSVRTGYLCPYDPAPDRRFKWVLH